MSKLNKVILTGRLKRDPEVRYTTEEKPVAFFELLVDKGKGKEAVRCIAMGGLAKIIVECLCKKMLVAVEGKLRIDEDSKTEVEVESIQMLDFKK